MTGKKNFFSGKTKAEILQNKKVRIGNLNEIANLRSDEYAIISPLVPRIFKTARKFMKHGDEVKLRRFRSAEEAMDKGLTPVELREKAFNRIGTNLFCGYSFMPLGRDRRKRKVPLIECLEGARLYSYSHREDIQDDKIKIKAYADSPRVRTEGAEIVAHVPSRTNNHGTDLKLIAIPVADSIEKYAFCYNFGSDHSCGAKRFSIRYRYSDDKEGSNLVNICCHEIAANLEIINQYWNKKKNIIPLQMCLFAIPSQSTVGFYLNLENRVLVKDKALESKDQLRRMNRAEKEIALWTFVRKFGHDKTFFSEKSRDGDVAHYFWT